MSWLLLVPFVYSAGALVFAIVLDVISRRGWWWVQYRPTVLSVALWPVTVLIGAIAWPTAVFQAFAARRGHA